MFKKGIQTFFADYLYVGQNTILTTQKKHFIAFQVAGFLPGWYF
jgi:hypothetical protein